MKIKHIDGKYRLIIDNLIKVIEARKNRDETLTIVIDGKKYRIKADKISENKFYIRVGDEEFTITFDAESKMYFINGEPYNVKIIKEKSTKTSKSIRIPFVKRGSHEVYSNCVVSPITGKIVSIHVNPGDKVNKGDVIAVIESMKIRNEISSDKSGVVKKIYYAPGQVVKKGEKIIELE